MLDMELEHGSDGFFVSRRMRKEMDGTKREGVLEREQKCEAVKSRDACSMEIVPNLWPNFMVVLPSRNQSRDAGFERA